MRAFVFTLDAFISLILVFFAISALLYISSTPKSVAGPYSRLYMVADDSLDVLANVRLENGTALALISRFASEGEAGEQKAGALAKQVLEPIIPSQFGFSVEYENSKEEWKTLYSRERPQTSMRVTSVRVVSGAGTRGQSGGNWCLDEDCPFCNGMPAGYFESENFGPILLRISVWV